jgi:hypothetical protein
MNVEVNGIICQDNEVKERRCHKCDLSPCGTCVYWTIIEQTCFFIADVLFSDCFIRIQSNIRTELFFTPEVSVGTPLERKNKSTFLAQTQFSNLNLTFEPSWHFHVSIIIRIEFSPFVSHEHSTVWAKEIKINCHLPHLLTGP